MSAWLLEPATGGYVLTFAIGLMAFPIVCIGLALLFDLRRPKKPDDHDDPGTWGDQSTPPWRR